MNHLSLLKKACREGICKILCLGLAILSPPLYAAPAPNVDAPGAVQNPARVNGVTELPRNASQEITKGGIVPHRAAYALHLASTKNGSHVSDIVGRMFFSFVDDCHAWNVEQKTQMRFFYSEGEVSDNTTILVSREEKDGSAYNFHVRRTTDKEEPEILHGSATLVSGADGQKSGIAIYLGTDQDRQVPLSANTLFPMQHTLQLLEHARAGKKFFAVDVFDGSDENGLNEISSFISPATEADNMIQKASTQTHEKTDASSASLLDNPLLKVAAWPVRMAFFAPKSETDSPDYEMDMVLLDNGVIKTMTVDYGDFAMTADLIDVKPLPASKCSKAEALPPS